FGHFQPPWTWEYYPKSVSKKTGAAPQGFFRKFAGPLSEEGHLLNEHLVPLRFLFDFWSIL
ncbi:MAG: hypothetical protein SCI25_01935, partial [Desulfuromonadales bacterium]|nr:hypothetical protein [Desulfuromonadales bacterium]MDW7756168.1 hypothetical protein [Desulfuromonadales bacterium]